MDAPRPVRRRWIYPVATILVGVMWYLAFLVGPGGWELMTQPHMLLAVSSPIVPFLCFLLTGFLLGAASRPIFAWTGKRIAVITGLSVSFLGSILYVWLLFFVQVAIDVVAGGSHEEIPPLDGSSLLAITCIGPFIAMRYGLVTVPVAVVSGLVLHWASRPRPGPSPRPPAR